MLFMQILNSAGHRHFRLVSLLSLCVALLTTAGCGPQVIEGRPPFVSISGMNLDGNTLTTRFDIANQNGVAMNIDAAEITVKVRDTELLRYTSTDALEITANSTETVTTTSEPESFTVTLLNSLDDGQLDSLSIDISGRVHTPEDGYLRFEQNGYLYRVPGRPGQFRSAVTQSKGLVREEPR